MFVLDCLFAALFRNQLLRLRKAKPHLISILSFVIECTCGNCKITKKSSPILGLYEHTKNLGSLLCYMRTTKAHFVISFLKNTVTLLAVTLLARHEISVFQLVSVAKQADLSPCCEPRSHIFSHFLTPKIPHHGNVSCKA